MILYIGNKLSKHGSTPTSVETLGNALAEEYEMITVSDKANKLLRLIDMIWAIIRHRKYVSLILIDTYSTLNFYYAVISAWQAKILKIPYVPILHGGNLPERIQKNRKMSDFIFQNAKINIAPSNYLLEAFKMHGYKVQYIPNSIALENYPFTERKTIRPKLLYVRAFSQVYNPQMAIYVLHKVLQKYPDAKLCMVGPDKDGTLEETKDLTRKLGIENHVVFMGKMKQKEWIAMSKEYDIFINTTNADNTPVSVIEAMALGLPVISTKVGGIPYLIEDGFDGLLVEPKNTDEMCKKIEYLMEHPYEAYTLATTARKKAEFFSWGRVKKQWYQVISSISQRE